MSGPSCLRVLSFLSPLPSYPIITQTCRGQAPPSEHFRDICNTHVFSPEQSLQLWERVSPLGLLGKGGGSLGIHSRAIPARPLPSLFILPLWSAMAILASQLMADWAILLPGFQGSILAVRMPCPVGSLRKMANSLRRKRAQANILFPISFVFQHPLDQASSKSNLMCTRCACWYKLLSF